MNTAHKAIDLRIASATMAEGTIELRKLAVSLRRASRLVSSSRGLVALRLVEALIAERAGWSYLPHPGPVDIAEDDWEAAA